MCPESIKQKLIDKTIEVIAKEGIGKTTTKALTADTGVNEGYIYRYFSGKEGLLSETFDMLDEELVSKTLQYIDVMYMENLDYELRCRVYFEAVWKFLLGNSDKCLAFIRYYYSPYFNKYSIETHKQRYAPLLNKISEAFKEEANVWMLLKHMLNIMLDFSIRVFNGEVPDDADTAEHVFRLVYNSVNQYFKN